MIAMGDYYRSKEALVKIVCRAFDPEGRPAIVFAKIGQGGTHGDLNFMLEDEFKNTYLAV